MDSSNNIFMERLSSKETSQMHQKNIKYIIYFFFLKEGKEKPPVIVRLIIKMNKRLRPQLSVNYIFRMQPLYVDVLRIIAIMRHAIRTCVVPEKRY